ncbi:MAG: c-type cytochrome [Chloroflexi bacterium]|nr:c-type cytochrome [Chloroflexota bacterium]
MNNSVNHARRRAMIRLIVITAVLFFVLLYQVKTQQHGRVAIAIAKNNQMLTMGSDPQLLLTLADLPAAPANTQFVEAVRLAASEAQPWDCAAYECALAIFYDLAQSLTIHQIVKPETGQILGQWEDVYARPAGSSHVLPLAMEIAAADPQVTAVLGDIGAVDPVMVPMSGWLADDDCRDQWCVDLTFHSPLEDGRVYHVFVNLEQQKVARTFYTRGREELNAALPVSQRDAFRNGCHDEFGWHLCWEMTASDGLNFTEATYNGNPVFTSVKIGQVEAWYPSWPGGYRDEIGFNASVRPFGGTDLIPFEDGFEVGQMFTEFSRWPNCICCYRYEQIVRLFADGSFEFRFVSHGPGCDDLSQYRPFWRIELAGNQDVWTWQEQEWTAVAQEQELHPFVEDLSPDGYKLATDNGEQLYQWQLERTDPLGLDEARLFLLQQNENEGEGPITAGPGDTYQPPRQWINNDPISGEEMVIWYVPILKTKKGGPWWCMPDPEPDINQCDAILRAVPTAKLNQPTAEELSQMPTPTATATAAPTNIPAPTPTPRPIEGATAEEVILNSGCGACHAIGALGEGGKVGPDLSDIGAAAGERIAGLSAADYLRQSILDPNAHLVPDCPNGPCLANIMPRDYTSRLTPEQIETMVTFLLTQIEVAPEELTIIGDGDLPPTAVSKSAPLSKTTNQPAAAGLEAQFAVQLLLLGMVFLLTMILVRQRPYDEKSS